METQKNVFYNVVLAISQVLFPLITFPYLARVLGPSQLGLINFAESIARYFILLAALGIPIYGVREIAKYQQNSIERTKAFFEISIINLITTSVLAIVFIILVHVIPTFKMDTNLYIWAIYYFILQMFYFEWFFTGMNQFKYIAIRSFGIRFLFILFVFLLIKTKEDYLKYMQMQVGLSLLIGLINFKYLYQLLDFKVAIFKSLDLKKHLKPLLILFLTIFSISVYFSLDTIFLGFLAGNESVGYYTSALKLTKLIIAVLSAISVAMFPKMINIYHQGDSAKFNEMVKQCFTLLVSISLPLMVIIGGLAAEIIQLLLGSHFERAVLPLQITAPLILIVSLSGIFGFQVLSALSKDKSILMSAIIGMLFSIILSITLVPLFKENGEAITILLTELSVCVSFIYFSQKYFSLNGYAKIFFNQASNTIPYIIIIFFIKLFSQDYLFVLFSTGIISLLWFSLFNFYFRPNNVFKEQFMRILHKRRLN